LSIAYQCVSEKVAVHAWPAIRARDEVCGLGQRTTEVGVVGLVSMDLEELIVGRHSRCDGPLQLAPDSEHGPPRRRRHRYEALG
jgi:hypothetical protein